MFFNSAFLFVFLFVCLFVFVVVICLLFCFGLIFSRDISPNTYVIKAARFSNLSMIVMNLSET